MSTQLFGQGFGLTPFHKECQRGKYHYLRSLFCPQRRPAQTNKDWSTSVNIGHQMCKAEGGASCSEKEGGLATSVSLDYAVLSWLDVGLESGFGQFPGSDGCSLFQPWSSSLQVTVGTNGHWLQPREQDSCMFGTPELSSASAMLLTIIPVGSLFVLVVA